MAAATKNNGRYLLNVKGDFIVVDNAPGISADGHLLQENGLPVANPKIPGAELVLAAIRDMEPTREQVDKILTKPPYKEENYFLEAPSDRVVAAKLIDGDYNFNSEQSEYLLKNMKYFYENGYLFSLIKALHHFVPGNSIWYNANFQRFAGYNEFWNAVMDNDVDALRPFTEVIDSRTGRTELPLPRSALYSDEFIVLQYAACERDNDAIMAILESFKNMHYFKSTLRAVMIAAVSSNNIDIVRAILSYAENQSSTLYPDHNYATSLVNLLDIVEFARNKGFDEIADLAAKYKLPTAEMTPERQKEHKPEALINFEKPELKRKATYPQKELEFTATTDEVEPPFNPTHPSFNPDVFKKIYPIMQLAYEIEDRDAHYGVEAAYKMAIIYGTAKEALEAVVDIMAGYASRGVGSLLVFSLPDSNEWDPKVWREPLRKYGKKAASVVEEAALIQRIVESRPEEYNLKYVVEQCCERGSADRFYADEAGKLLRNAPTEIDKSLWFEFIELNPKMAFLALDNKAFSYIGDLNNMRVALGVPGSDVTLSTIKFDDIKILYFLSLVKGSDALIGNAKFRDIVSSVITGKIDSGGLEELKSHLTVGVEIEYHGIKKDDLPALNALIQLLQDGWNQTIDSSVEPEDAEMLGLETVSPVLGDKKRGVSSVNSIVGAIKSLGGKVSKQCALHVHVGITKNFPPENQLDIVKQALINYATLDEKLKFMDSRLTYPYKQVFSDNGMTFPRAIEAIKDAKNFDELMKITQPEGRRRARINLQPLLTYGTVEFRQHPGSVEPSEVTAWVKFIDNFMHKTIAMATTPDGPHKPSKEERIELEALVDGYIKERGNPSKQTSVLQSWGTIPEANVSMLC